MKSRTIIDCCISVTSEHSGKSLFLTTSFLFPLSDSHTVQVEQWEMLKVISSTVYPNWIKSDNLRWAIKTEIESTCTVSSQQCESQVEFMMRKTELIQVWQRSLNFYTKLCVSGFN